MKLIPQSFKTNEKKYFFNTMDVNFRHLLPQEVVETGTIQRLGKFVDSSSMKRAKRSCKGYTLAP